MLGKLVYATMSVRNTTTFALDADKRVRFKYIEDAMNTLRKNKAFIFNFVTDKRKGVEKEPAKK
jgi:biopolymer transport protein ExbD